LVVAGVLVMGFNCWLVGDMQVGRKDTKTGDGRTLKWTTWCLAAHPVMRIPSYRPIERSPAATGQRPPRPQARSVGWAVTGKGLRESGSWDAGIGSSCKETPSALVGSLGPSTACAGSVLCWSAFGYGRLVSLLQAESRRSGSAQFRFQALPTANDAAVHHTHGLLHALFRYRRIQGLRGPSLRGLALWSSSFAISVSQ